MSSESQSILSFQSDPTSSFVRALPLTHFSVNNYFPRMNFVSTSCSLHLAKMEFLENKHKMQAFLGQAEFKIKSWIIKYGRQESVDLMLRDYAVSSGLVFSLLCLSNTRTKCAKTICVIFSIQNFYNIATVFDNIFS